MPRVIAIDWGAKRVGLAITDELQLIASPLTTVDTNDIWTYLQTYFTKENVVKAVIGLPLQLNGLPSESQGRIEQFVKEFQNKFPDIQVVRIDERFTSKMASQSMVQSGMRKSQRQNKGNVDQIAATILLQDYLLRKAIS